MFSSCYNLRLLPLAIVLPVIAANAPAQTVMAGHDMAAMMGQTVEAPPPTSSPRQSP